MSVNPSIAASSQHSALDEEEMNPPSLPGELPRADEAGMSSRESKAPPPSYDSVAASYTPSEPASAAAPADPIAQLSRSSHISAHQENHSLKISHVIDLAFPTPVHELPPLAVGETDASKRLNGKFTNQNQSVVVQVGICDSKLGERTYEEMKGAKQRVRIAARSVGGPVTVKIFQRTPGLPFSLEQFSQNGSVTVYLPRDFHGVISHVTQNGTFQFSSEIRSRLTTINNEKSEGLSFVGDMMSWKGKAELQDAEEEALDQVSLKSVNGSVKVRFFEDAGDRNSGFVIPSADGAGGSCTIA